MTTVTELRCPVGPRSLLAKVRSEGGIPVVTNDNLMEFSCRDCSRELRREDSGVARVLHRFNFLGQLVESQVVRRG